MAQPACGSQEAVTAATPNPSQHRRQEPEGVRNRLRQKQGYSTPLHSTVTG